MNDARASGDTLANENELIARACAGDREAYGLLVEQYSSVVVKTLYYRVGDYGDAEDLAQEVFVRAYRGLSAFKRNASFRTWLYRIVHNVAASHFAFKSAKKRSGSVTSIESLGTAAALAAPDREPEDRAMSQELRAAIEEAVQSLPPDMRELVVLRDMEQRSYEEICTVTETPLGTVKSRIHRGRLLLREKLARYL